MSAFGLSPRIRRGPYAQPSRSFGACSCQSSSKTYVIDVPVYAAPDGQEDQSAWNNVTHKFTITEAAETKTFEVSQNMANPHTAQAKIYPATGVTDSDGNSYFPVNTWAFGVSPRNLKQYNYQMLLDSLVWNGYVIRGVDIKFTPRMGANQPGFLEAVLLNNAQIMPSAPFTNQSNSCSFTATQAGSFSFAIDNIATGGNAKNMKSVQTQFDSSADFGILWFRTAGFSNISAITEVAKLQIRISVGLSNYSPSPYAQLIGPWIEAGYPIDAEGGSVVQTKSTATTGTAMLAVYPEEAVDVKRLAKGRAQMPRWRLVPTTDDKFVVNLGAAGLVHAKAQVKRLAARRLGVDADKQTFPDTVQGDFDGAVSGKTFLDDVAENNSGVHQVVDPSNSPAIVDQTGIYLKPDATTIYPATVSEGDTRFQLVYYPDSAAVNSAAIAQGGVGVQFTGSTENLGLRVGTTLKFITSFGIGAIPLEGEFADATTQVAAGYEPGLGNTSSESSELETETDGWGSIIGTALNIAGAFGKALVGKDGQLGSFKSSLANTWNTARKKVGYFIAGESNAELKVQSSAFEVPDNAFFESIGEYPAESYNKLVSEEFFGDVFPMAAKYGVQRFEPEKMTNTQARLTVTGQVNSLHQAVLGLEGTAPEGAKQLAYNADVKDVFVLVASKVDPTEDPQGFYKTAIPVTSIPDSVNTTSTAGSLYVNRASGSAGHLVFNKTTTNGNRIRENNSTVAGFNLASLVSFNPCNLTFGFPDKLVNKDTLALEAVSPGDTIYFSLIKSTAVTYSHVISESTGAYTFWVLPNLVGGTDTAAAGQALHKYELDLDSLFVVSGITQGAELTQTVYMLEDGERRFSLEVTTPSDSGSNAAAEPKKALKCVKN